MEKKSFMKKLTGSREALLAVILVLLFVVITIISPSFLTFKSLTDMLKNNAVTMVMSLGMLCVMLVGGIDISIMSTLALTGMSIGMLLKYEHISSTFLAFVIALAIGIACGFRGRSCNLQSRCTSDHCNNGLHVHLPCNGISGFPQW